jgi:hypothetical protein
MQTGVRSTLPFKLLSPGDVENLPDLEWLIQGVLPVGTFGVLYGEPGSGKTFVALSMAFSCASGHDWLGRPTRPVKVLYIAAEGVLGLKNRLRAHRHRRGLNPENIRFIASPLAISELDHVRALANFLKNEGFKPTLIVIDTLARVSVGKEENSAKDMGEIIAGFDELRRETGATVLVIHHTRKDGGSERGSSALRGAADVMILCEKGDPSSVTLQCKKMKDDEPFSDIDATLEKVNLPGGTSSLIVGELIDTLTATGEAAEAIVQILEQRFAESGATHSELVKAYCAKTGKSKSTFDRAWRDLKNTDRVRLEQVKGKGLIFPASVNVIPVSKRCQTPTQISVMSPPSLGGDTDTKSKETN